MFSQHRHNQIETKPLQGIFPEAKIKKCVKHAQRNLRKGLQKIQNQRGFAVGEKESLKKSHGALLDWVSADVIWFLTLQG